MEPSQQERLNEAIVRADEKVHALLRSTKDSLNDTDNVTLALSLQEAQHALGELAAVVALSPEEMLVAAHKSHVANTRKLREVVASHQEGKASADEVAEALDAAVESAKEIKKALQYLERKRYIFYVDIGEVIWKDQPKRDRTLYHPIPRPKWRRPLPP